MKEEGTVGRERGGWPRGKIKAEYEERSERKREEAGAVDERREERKEQKRNALDGVRSL